MKAKKYLLFFLLGYCIYIAIEVTYRGYSFRLMGIAGGLSLAGIGMLEDAGLRRFPPGRWRRWPLRAVPALPPGRTSARSPPE